MKKVPIDKIIRSKRKTFALQIAHDASLTVRVPLTASVDMIEKVVTKKADWIRRKQKEIKERYQRAAPKEFVDGEDFMYLGETYKLRITEDQADSLIFNNEFCLLRREINNAEEVFIAWYKKAARDQISARVNDYAKKTGLPFNKVKITNAKQRWGSCSARGNLNFAWRLIMAPLSVIDYVIIHELAHLKHQNHSRRYWTTVAVMMPGYRKERQWLKDNGHLLTI
jgi:predicted metal-dependent hydrolase